MNQIRNSYQNSNNSSNSNNNNNFNSSNQNGSGAINKQVFQQDQPELAMTLQEIMRRLSAMEARQAVLPIHTQMIAPNLSPTVPQPGTQTQRQWGSPNPWTQSQC
jgi:cell division inhibitor SulA